MYIARKTSSDLLYDKAMQTTVMIRQHEQFERSIRWRIVFVIIFLVLIVMSFLSPSWTYDDAGTIGMMNNRLNAILLCLIVGVYLTISIFRNRLQQISIDDTGTITRDGTAWIRLQEYPFFSLLHHGKHTQYYTIYLLHEDHTVAKVLPCDDEASTIHTCVEKISGFCELTEEVNFHWYEKIQRFLKL